MSPAIRRVKRFLLHFGESLPDAAGTHSETTGRWVRLTVADLRALVAAAERCESLERTVREVVTYDAHANGLPSLDTEWIHQDGVNKLRVALSPPAKSRAGKAKKGAK